MAQDNTSPVLASTIYRFGSNGGTPTPFGSLPGQGFGLEFNSAGNLFAADFLDRQIFAFAPDGTRTLFATVGTANGFTITGPTDLAFHNSGNLFVAVSPSRGAPLNTPSEIIEITPQGVQTVFASGLPGDIFGLAFDMSGNLFATDRGFGQILEFTPEGVDSVLPIGLLAPTFLTFGPPSSRSVPDTGTTAMLLGIALSGFGLLRQFVRQ
jgi:hypothetical protein